MCGVHFITQIGLESILVIFPLKTPRTERIIAALLPLPFNSIDEIIDKVNKRFNKQKTFEIACYAFDPNADYLRDIKHIKHTLDWIEKKRAYKN